MIIKERLKEIRATKLILDEELQFFKKCFEPDQDSTEEERAYLKKCYEDCVNRGDEIYQDILSNVPKKGKQIDSREFWDRIPDMAVASGLIDTALRVAFNITVEELAPYQNDRTKNQWEILEEILETRKN